MVAIMWLTGGKKPQTPAKAASSAAPVQAPLEVNETKIAEMQNRIQDLQRQQLLAQTALAQQTRSLGAAAHDAAEPQQPGAVGSGEQRAGRRPDPGRTEAARLRLAVRLECRSQLPENSSELDGPGNRNSACRSGSAPFGPRRITDPPTLERDAVQSDFSRASPQRFRGNNT